MKKIEEIDKNFKSDDLGDKELVFHSVPDGCDAFELTGFGWYNEEKEFCRLPRKTSVEINEGPKILSWHTSGGMIRFRTNSRTIGISAELRSSEDMSHMPRTGISGFDLYVGERDNRTFVKQAMPAAGKAEVKGILQELHQKKMRECLINFPLYNGVKRLHIGFEVGSRLEKPSPFTVAKPLIFYGSSITQGGCASRPGNAYTHFIARWLDANMLNFGFSGLGKGEPEMAKLIASLEMSAFIMDYDNNAPDVEHLKRTHEPFFQIIRKSHPTLPVIVVSRTPVNTANSTENARRQVIASTYNNAIMAGDQNVYFIDGWSLFGSRDRDACTVDGGHPNDLGFYRMAEGIFPVVKEALIKGGQL